MVHVGRRRLLLGSAAAVFAAGCGSSTERDDSSNEGGSGDPTTERQRARFTLAPMFPAAGGFVVAGIPQRMPFRIFDDEGLPFGDVEETMVLRVGRDGESETEAPLIAHVANDDAAYFTANVTFGSEGIYEVTTSIGDAALSSAIQVDSRSEIDIPQVGDVLTAIATPTVTEPLGVSPYCTNDPPCPLHEKSVSDIVGRQPLALYVGTPAYCQIGVCGPLLDLVVASATTHPGIAYVHAEVYENPDDVDSIVDARAAPIMGELGLTYEPVLVVTDGSGTVTARLDTIFDDTELQAALDTVG